MNWFQKCNWLNPLPFLLIGRGVILMRLEHAGKIQSASLISGAEVESEEGEEAKATVAAE